MSLNSEKIFSGVEHADARSLLYATGHLQENIGRKPLIGVVNTFNEIVPGHFHLRKPGTVISSDFLQRGHSIIHAETQRFLRRQFKALRGAVPQIDRFKIPAQIFLDQSAAGAG